MYVQLIYENTFDHCASFTTVWHSIYRSLTAIFHNTFITSKLQNEAMRMVKKQMPRNKLQISQSEIN